MKPHHVSVLAAMQGGKPMTVKEISKTTGMTTMRIRNSIRDLHYNGYLVMPAERKRPNSIYEIDLWKLSADGRRLVEAMRRHFKGE